MIRKLAGLAGGLGALFFLDELLLLAGISQPVWLGFGLAGPIMVFLRKDKWALEPFAIFLLTLPILWVREELNFYYLVGTPLLLLLITRMQKPPESPDWFGYVSIRLFQVFLGFGVLLFGFPFVPTALTIFLVEMIDSMPLGGVPLGKYQPYRSIDWAFDYFCFLPLWVWAIGYGWIKPFAYAWIIGLPLVGLVSTRIPDSVAFKPATLALFFGALVGFIPFVVGLSFVFNPWFEFSLHREYWILKGTQAFWRCYAATLVWASFCLLVLWLDEGPIYGCKKL